MNDLIHRAHQQPDPAALLSAIREQTGSSITAWERTASSEDVERVWTKAVWRVSEVCG